MVICFSRKIHKLNVVLEDIKICTSVKSMFELQETKNNVEAIMISWQIRSY